MIVVNAKKFRYGAWHIDFSGVYKGKLYFTVTDTTKYHFDKGYRKDYSRKLTSAKTIKFDGFTFNVSAIVD
jgi:hypothetical protein